MGTLLEGIPDELDQAIVIAQHRSAESTRGVLESLLQRHIARPVSEPDDKEPDRAAARLRRARGLPPPRRRRALRPLGRGPRPVRAPVDRRPLRVGRRGLPRPRDRDRAHGRERRRRRRARGDQAERRCRDRPGPDDRDEEGDAGGGDRGVRRPTRCCRSRRSGRSSTGCAAGERAARSSSSSTTGPRTCSRSRRSSSRSGRSSSARGPARRRCGTCSRTSSRRSCSTSRCRGWTGSRRPS